MLIYLCCYTMTRSEGPHSHPQYPSHTLGRSYPRLPAHFFLATHRQYRIRESMKHATKKMSTTAPANQLNGAIV